MVKNTVLTVLAFLVVVLAAGIFLLQPKIEDINAPKPQNPADLPSLVKEDQATSPTPSGFKSEDIKVGTGKEAKSGDTVVVNYKGTLTNGKQFDSSYDRKQPFTTKIGVGQVIKGWDIGIQGMKVGGKRKLTIPPDLGYGAQAAGSIPPNSTLLFEVELLDVK